MNRALRRAAGFTLLPVILAMTLIAAIAFLLNRDNGMNAAMVSSQMDADRAHYAAEAGLQAVNARMQSLSCAGGYPVAGAPLTNNNFGGASYAAYAGASSGSPAVLTSVGTFNGTSVTLTRANTYVYQTAPKTYTLQPNGTIGLDTTIDAKTEKNFGADNKLVIKKNQQHLLFKFDLSAFPAGSRPVSATLSIYGSGGIGASLDLFRMTRAWVEGTGSGGTPDGVTWNTSNGSTAWTPGGNYHTLQLNATSSGSLLNSWVSFDATDMTAAWLSGQYPIHGVLVKSTGESGTYKYTSSDDSNAASRPKITFNYMVPCGATGPVDTPLSTVTLSPTADSFNDSGAAQVNNGVATTLTAYYTPTRENRALIQFDTSSIPAGITVASAKLRMYVSSVGSATALTKAIWANAINEPWVEGAGNNTSKFCPFTTTAGTSWNYRTNCTNWSFIHPPNTPQGWTAMAPMPTARSGHVVAMVNNKIYAIGGQLGNGTALNVVEEYTPATNSWATKTPMPTARRMATGAVVNGKIYVMGGEKASVAQSVNEVYDPATDTWVAKAAMPAVRRKQAAAVVSNKIYVFGGTSSTIATKTNYQYDPATNAWSSKAAMTTARNSPAAAAVNGKIYVFGGWTGFLSTAVNEIYDPASDSWTSGAAMPVGTDALASAVMGNKIYLIAGHQSFLTTNAVRMYDTLSNTYKNQANYPIATEQTGAALYNGYVYSTGGDNGMSTVHPAHYKFDPGTPEPVATAVDESTGNSPLAANFNKGWITFELKLLVQEWVDGIRPNNGLMIYTEVADQLNINSRENSGNKPQLIVTY